MNTKILKIFNEARSCKRCYGDTLLHVPLPDDKNGGIGAKILFLVERPGRIGTGQSGRVSFENRDPTAAFFRDLFSTIAMSRKEIFITNAVLCHPILPMYRDRSALSTELANCQYFLSKQVRVIRPKLIVTLGLKALQAVKYLYPDRLTLQRFKLKENLGAAIMDRLPFIYPLYHTSLRARITRPEQQQRTDWLQIPMILQKAEDRP